MFIPYLVLNVGVIKIKIMAYLGRGKKEDLLVLASELEIEVDPSMKIMAIKNKITQSDTYDEEFTKEIFLSVVEERKRKEEMEEKMRKEELEEKLRKEESEAQWKREERDMN